MCAPYPTYVRIIPRQQKIRGSFLPYLSEKGPARTQRMIGPIFSILRTSEIKSECAKFSEDVKYFAEFQTGIKAFDPWMKKAEQRIIDGLKQPKSLVEACEILGDSKVTLAPPKMCLGRNVIYTSSFPLRTSKKNVRRS